jgi:hypothetical protein
MKKYFFIVITSFFVLTTSNLTAQIWSPQLAGYSGYGTIWGQPNAYGTPLSIYQGNVINGVAHGYGTWYFINGDIFLGTFSNGFADGPGVYYQYGGGCLQGCWRNGYYAGSCGSNVNDLYRRRGYGGADDALVGTVSNSPGAYSTNQNNYNTNSTTSSGRDLKRYGGF